MHRSVERGLSRRSGSERYYYLSIDEKSIHRGHDCVSILSDESTGVVLEVVGGRTKESVKELCTKALTEAQRDDVNTICTDMWDAYIYGAETYFPKAKHCHDNFHLVGYLNKAVDKVRRREVKHFDELKKTKYLWLKDKLNFTERQRLQFESICQSNYAVSGVWQIKENFRDIQFRQNRAEAISMYAYWRMDAKHAQIPEINDVVEMFDRHQKGIINAIETGANNARAERINGSVQEIKTRGSGYAKTENFRIAILFWHGDLDLFSHEIQ